MKRLLITGAALFLMSAGAAAAQDATTSQTGVGSPAATAGAPAPTVKAGHSKRVKASVNASKDAVADAMSPSTPSATGTPATALVDGSAQTTSATNGSAMASSSTSATASTPTIVGDQSQINPAPASGAYPPCTRKGQDRCMVTAQTHRRTPHHRTTHKNA